MGAALKFLRVIGGVIVGYVAMAALVIAGSYAAGAIFAGEGGEPTEMYLIANLVISLLAALVGGYVAAWVGGPMRLIAAGVLAVLVLVMGFLMGGGAGQPDWYGTVLPLIGAVGVIVGGWLRHEPEARTHVM